MTMDYTRENEERVRFERESRKDPDQLEREIDATRAHMERTLDALERRLSPGELMDELIAVVRRNGGGFARNFGVQVRNNPVPALLTGIGLAWLMAASDREPQPRYAVGTSGPGVRDRVRSSASTLGSGAHRATDSVRSATAHVGSGVRHAGEAARRSVRRAGSLARSGRARVGGTYHQLIEQQPLLLGGLGLALGAALGAMTPSTEVEDELLGDTSDRVVSRARAAGEEQYAKARRAAERAAQAAREEGSAEWKQQQSGPGTPV